MSMHSSTHSSQMNTVGPAMSFAPRAGSCRRTNSRAYSWSRYCRPCSSQNPNTIQVIAAANSAGQPRLRSATTGRTLKMAVASSIIEEAPQLPRPARVPQLPKGLGLDLADSFTRDRELNPNLLQGVVLVHTDAEAHAEDAFFAWRQ